MGFEINHAGDELDEAAAGPGASDEFDGDPADADSADAGALVVWPSVFDGLDDAARDALVGALADMWAGNLARPESEDDQVIDAIVDEVGQDGLGNILLTVPGTPRRVGALLLTAIFLDSSSDQIVRATRYKAKEVEKTANEIHVAVLHGDVTQARTVAVDALTNLHKSLSITMFRNRRMGGLRVLSEALRSRAAELLAALDAPVPDDTAKKQR